MIAQKTENWASIQGQKGSSCPRSRALLSLWRWPRHRPAQLAHASHLASRPTTPGA